MTSLEELATFSVTKGAEASFTTSNKDSFYRIVLRKYGGPGKYVGIICLNAEKVLSPEKRYILQQSQEKNKLYVTPFPIKDNEKGYTFPQLEKAYSEGRVSETQATSLIEQKLHTTERYKHATKAVHEYNKMFEKIQQVSTTKPKDTANPKEEKDVFDTQKLTQGIAELVQSQATFNKTKAALDSNMILAKSIVYEALGHLSFGYAGRLAKESSYLQKPEDIFIEEWQGEKREEYKEATSKLSEEYVFLGRNLFKASEQLKQPLENLKRDPIQNPSNQNHTKQTRQLYHRVRENILS